MFIWDEHAHTWEISLWGREQCNLHFLPFPSLDLPSLPKSTIPFETGRELTTIRSWFHSQYTYSCLRMWDLSDNVCEQLAPWLEILWFMPHSRQTSLATSWEHIRDKHEQHLGTMHHSHIQLENKHNHSHIQLGQGTYSIGISLWSTHNSLQLGTGISLLVLLWSQHKDHWHSTLQDPWALDLGAKDKRAMCNV